MARRTTKDPRRIMDVLMSAHNDANALNGMNASDNTNASSKVNKLDRTYAPDDMHATEDINAANNTAAPQATASPEPAPDPTETDIPNTPDTPDNDLESAGRRELNFFNQQRYVLSLFYSKIALFRTQLAPLVATTELQPATALNTIENTSSPHAEKARQKYRLDGTVMTLKAFLVGCANHALELDELEGKVRTMEWEVGECEEGAVVKNWQWGRMAEFIEGKVEQSRARHERFGVDCESQTLRNGV